MFLLEFSEDYLSYISRRLPRPCSFLLTVSGPSTNTLMHSPRSRRLCSVPGSAELTEAAGPWGLPSGGSALAEATLCADTCEARNAIGGRRKEKSASREGGWDGVVGRKDFSKDEAQPRGLEGWGGCGL